MAKGSLTGGDSRRIGDGSESIVFENGDGNRVEFRRGKGGHLFILKEGTGESVLMDPFSLFDILMNKYPLNGGSGIEI